MIFERSMILCLVVYNFVLVERNLLLFVIPYIIDVYKRQDGYRDFLEQQLTHNRRSLTETEILDIQNRCEQLYDLCGE